MPILATAQLTWTLTADAATKRFRGRLLAPTTFHGEPGGAWSMFVWLDEYVGDGDTVTAPVALLMDDAAGDRLCPGTTFTLENGRSVVAHGTVWAASPVSEEALRAALGFSRHDTGLTRIEVETTVVPGDAE